MGYDNSESYLTFYSDRKATIAEFNVYIGNTRFASSGSSWRASGDPYDEDKGRLIALSRAVEELRDNLKREVAKLEA